MIGLWCFNHAYGKEFELNYHSSALSLLIWHVRRFASLCCDLRLCVDMELTNAVYRKNISTNPPHIPVLPRIFLFILPLFCITGASFYN